MDAEKKGQGNQVTQKIKTRDITSEGNVTISQNATQHGPVTLSPEVAAFIAQLEGIISELGRHTSISPSIKEAQEELQSATDEARSPKPEGKKIGRFVAYAKSLLEGVITLAAPLGSAVKSLEVLAKQVPALFG